MKAAFVLLGLLLATAAQAQEASPFLIDRAPEARPSLLILGSVHLHNPGRDQLNFQVDDVLLPARQAEIEELVAQLAAFEPTHVVVEELKSNQAKLDERYNAYRAGKYSLARSEDEQIGMRLAAKLGHDRVYAADWNGAPPGDFANYNYSAYAKANGQEEKFKLLLNPKRIPYPPLASTDLVRFFVEINRPEAIARSHRIYFDVARFGDDQTQPGANWVGSWYARNLKIFNNIVDLTDNPGDRVLAIYGTGHVHHLRQFANESGAFRLHEVNEFVKAPAQR